MSLADYAVERSLGRGGFAEVELARAIRGPAAGTLVVVKRLLPELARDPAAVAQLLREARLVSRLRHRGLVSFVEGGVEDGVAFLVMEHVDGCDAGALVSAVRGRGWAIPPAFALAIAARAAGALHAAHRAAGQDGRPLGLVHCDVSPSNVLLSRAGEVKVTDFGVARVAGELSGRAALGKVRYLAPELARGGPVDARTDVFGVGAVLHELLTGSPAFEGDDPATVMGAITGGVRVPPSAAAASPLPPGTDALVLKALAVDPAGRFADAGELAQALGALFDEQVADALAIAALVRSAVGG